MAKGAETSCAVDPNVPRSVVTYGNYCAEQLGACAAACLAEQPRGNGNADVVVLELAELANGAVVDVAVVVVIVQVVVVMILVACALILVIASLSLAVVAAAFMGFVVKAVVFA